MKCVLWTLILFSRLAYGQDMLRYQEFFESRIDRILQKYDPLAYSSVLLRIEEPAIDLPGVPYGLKPKLNPSTIKFSSMAIQVYTSKKELPKDLLTALETGLKKLAGQVRISVTTIGYPETENSKINKVESNWQELVLHPLQKNLVWVILVVLFGVLASAGVLLLRSSITSLSRDLAKGISELSNLGGGSASYEAQSHSREKVEMTADTRWPRQVVARFLMDCYWTKKDSLAKAAFSLVSQEDLQLMVEEHPLLREYHAATHHLSADQDTNLAFTIAHPIYMSDSVWQRTSQEDLRAQLLKSSEGWSQISPLRRSDLGFRADEWLKLTENTDKGLKTPPKPSTPRSLKVVEPWYVATLEDFDHVLEHMADFSSTQKEQIVTMAWLKQLSPDQVRDLMASLSARQLSQVYWGPESFLAWLSEYIPEKKLQMVKSLQGEGFQYSASNDVLKRIHEQIIEHLQKPIDPAGGQHAA